MSAYNDKGGGYCRNCERNWHFLLDTATETMHKRDVNYCPTCGVKL